MLDRVPAAAGAASGRRQPGGFGRLLGAAAASNLGDGILWVALPLLAVSLTDSPALVAGVAVAAQLPWLLVAVFSGALVDRVDRRRAMVGVDALRAAIVAALAVAALAGAAGIWLLYVVAFVLGVLETVHDTASQAVVPVVVPDRDRLAGANGRLYAVEQVANQFVGPPVGGFLAGVAIAVALGTSAAGYLGAALLLATLSGVFRPDATGPRGSVLGEIREGLDYLLHHHVLRALALVLAGLNFAAGAVLGVLVLYVVAPGPMGLDPVGYGVLLTVMAVGTVAGTLAAGWVERRFGKAWILTAAILGLALQDLVLALSSSPVVVGGAFLVAGLLLGSFNPIFVAFRQRIVPDRLLGRVVATFRMLAIGTFPLGALAGGLLAQVLDLQAVFLASSGVCALLLPTRLVLTNAAMDRAVATAEASR